MGLFLFCFSFLIEIGSHCLSGCLYRVGIISLYHLVHKLWSWCLKVVHYVYFLSVWCVHAHATHLLWGLEDKLELVFSTMQVLLIELRTQGILCSKTLNPSSHLLAPLFKCCFKAPHHCTWFSLNLGIHFPPFKEKLWAILWLLDF